MLDADRIGNGSVTTLSGPSRFVQFSPRQLFCVVAAVALGFTLWLHEPYRLARKLRNDDVEFDGGFFGLTVVVKGKIALSLLATGLRATPALVSALDDPDTFAAAHVLLTKICEQTYETTGEEWNHLRVELPATGKAILYPAQIPVLRSYWRQRLATKEHH